MPNCFNYINTYWIRKYVHNQVGVLSFEKLRSENLGYNRTEKTTGKDSPGAKNTVLVQPRSQADRGRLQRKGRTCRCTDSGGQKHFRRSESVWKITAKTAANFLETEGL